MIKNYNSLRECHILQLELLKKIITKLRTYDTEFFGSLVCNLNEETELMTQTGLMESKSDTVKFLVRDKKDFLLLKYFNKKQGVLLHNTFNRFGLCEARFFDDLADDLRAITDKLKESEQ